MDGTSICAYDLLALALIVSRGHCFPLFCLRRAVPCCAVLFFAVLCCVWCHHTLSCGVFCCVLSWCAASSGRRVRRVVWGPPAFPSPPCFCPLLPLPGPLSWPVVVFCHGVRCCVGLLCRL